MKSYFFLASFAVAVLSLSGSACQSTPSTARAAPSLPPPAVTVIEVTPEDVPIYGEYAAETFARDMVEVRGRVDGYIEKRLFQVGSDVAAGQVLFELDKRPYEADVAKAKGDVAQSEANLEFARKQVTLLQAQADLAQSQANELKAKQDVDRLKPLVKEDAAAQQDLDNATAALQANEANVNARKAAVEQARLSTRAQIDTTQAQVEATSRAVANRGTESGIRDHPRAHRRPHRRQFDSGRRVGDENFRAAAHDDCSARSHLGAIQSQRKRVSEFPAPHRQESGDRARLTAAVGAG